MDSENSLALMFEAGKYEANAMKYADKGEYNLAIAEYEKAINLTRFSPSPVTYINLGNVYLKKGEEGDKNAYNEAIDNYTKAIDHGHTKDILASAYNQRGVAYLNKGGEDKEAFDDFSQSIEITPGITAYLNRITLYLEKGEYAKAIVDYDAVIALDRNNADSYFGQGMAYNGKGDCASASSPADYASAIADYTSAIDKYTKAITLGLEDVYTYNIRGSAYYKKGNCASSPADNTSAIADFAYAIKLNPNDAIAYDNLGRVYNDKGDYDLAIDNYTQAIKLNPNDADTYNNRGSAHYKKGDYDCAIADFTQAITLNPNSSSYRMRGEAYSKKGNYDQAITDCNESLALNPKNGKAVANRGSVHYQKGDYASAIADFTTAITLGLKDADTYNNRGATYNKKGDKTRAIADYNQALIIDPNNAEAKEQIKRLRKYLQMTSTQNFIADIDDIHNKFSELIASKDKHEANFEADRDKIGKAFTADRDKIDRDFAYAKYRTDADFNALDREIGDKYHAKIVQLESARDMRFSSVNSQVQKKQMQFQEAIYELERIKADIPQKFRDKYSKAAATPITPKIPDFQAMWDALKSINNTIFFPLMHGKANALIDEIEAGRAFIDGENQKWVEYGEQTKTIVDQEFQKEKEEVERKKADYEQKNKQNLAASTAEIQKKNAEATTARRLEFEANTAALLSKYDKDTAVLTSEFEREVNNPELPRFDEQLLDEFGKLGAKDAWEGYTPSEKYPDEIMLGTIEVPFDLKQSFNAKENEPSSLPVAAPVVETGWNTRRQMGGVVVGIPKFMVVLKTYDDSKKIAVIKEVRAVTGLGLKEAKELVESAPQLLKENITKDEAEKIASTIKDAGGTVEIRQA